MKSNPKDDRKRYPYFKSPDGVSRASLNLLVRHHKPLPAFVRSSLPLHAQGAIEESLSDDLIPRTVPGNVGSKESTRDEIARVNCGGGDLNRLGKGLVPEGAQARAALFICDANGRSGRDCLRSKWVQSDNHTFHDQHRAEKSPMQFKSVNGNEGGFFAKASGSVWLEAGGDNQVPVDASWQSKRSARKGKCAYRTIIQYSTHENTRLKNWWDDNRRQDPWWW